MQRFYIGLVGGGAAAIGFINKLAELNKDLKCKTVIYLFDKSDDFGPGNAYLPNDLNSNLLNTKAGYITALRDRPGHFFKWYNENLEKIQYKYPKIYSSDSYVPRALFGLYMKHTLNYVIKQALNSGINVVPINGEVINMEELSGKDKGCYELTTRCGIKLQTDYVVLACGTMKFKGNDDILNVYYDPYPVRNLVNKIDKNQSVAIIGARLSAIDTVIGLIEGGHQGEISIISRSGHFPRVRGKQGRYNCKHLNAAAIKKLAQDSVNGITLIDLAYLFFTELNEFRLTFDDQWESLSFPPEPINDFGAFLSQEIKLADKMRGWQAILYDTNSILGLVWDNMAPQERELFYQQYFSAAISMRVSIPVENAEKMLKFYQSGQLKFLVGDFSADKDPVTGSHILRGEHSEIAVDNIVWATGSPRDIKTSDSDFIKSMLSSGYVKNHPFGGIDTSPDHNIICQAGKVYPKIFAIGELTNGRFLFTSALDIIASHSANCAESVFNHWCNSFEYSRRVSA